MKSQDKKKVYVAMSGGVDSSVAAALLSAESGSPPDGRAGASGGKKYNVVGVFMKPWSPNHGTWNMKYGIKNSSPYSIVHSPCLWQRDREDAMKVAAKLGIPLLTWDFSKEYKKEVADHMIREYKAGRTPNPDVMCNKHIKFGLFLKKALKEGADFIATGHYVRKVVSSKKQVVKLLTARDKNKDQSYFLWTLTQEQLRHCLFPIGNYTKPEVRKLAKKFGLPTADKKDSQGVCFVGPLDMKEFLKSRIKPKKGRILDLSGNLIGYHDGVFYYTIGQRHGLDIKDGNGPYYVVGKDIVANTLVLAKGDNDDALYGKEAQLIDVNFIAQHHSQILQSSFDPAKRGQETTPRKNLGIKDQQILVRIRYRQPLVRAKIMFANSQNKNQTRVLFEKPQKALTSGQSAVFYRRDEMLGGGIIS